MCIRDRHIDMPAVSYFYIQTSQRQHHFRRSFAQTLPACRHYAGACSGPAPVSYTHLSYPSISPYDTFKAKDGYVSIGISTDNQWIRFCDALGMDNLKADEKYKTNESRGDNYESGLKEAIEKVTSKMSKFEIEKKLNDAKPVSYTHLDVYKRQAL